MMLTESEAKTKWCPHARTPWQFIHSDGYAPVNRTQHGEPYGACIASECMAWRRQYEHFESGGLPPDQCGRTEGDWERLSQHDWKRPTGRGYCGLAGDLP